MFLHDEITWWCESRGWNDGEAKRKHRGTTREPRGACSKPTLSFSLSSFLSQFLSFLSRTFLTVIFLLISNSRAIVLARIVSSNVNKKQRYLSLSPRLIVSSRTVRILSFSLSLSLLEDISWQCSDFGKYRCTRTRRSGRWRWKGKMDKWPDLEWIYSKWWKEEKPRNGFEHSV